MALDIKSVEYYNIIVGNHAGEGARLLSLFASAGVNLLAFKAVPVENAHTQFSLFPDDGSKMIAGAKKGALKLDGPHTALVIKGDGDESGELASIYEQLSQAGVEIKESSGIADINDSYGVVLYLEPGECEKAMAALKL